MKANKQHDIEDILIFFKSFILKPNLDKDTVVEVYGIIERLLIIVENIDNYQISIFYEFPTPIYEIAQKQKLPDDDILKSLNLTLNLLYERLTKVNIKYKNSPNSEKYYNKIIEDLENRERELRNNLELNKSETEEQKKVANETKKRLKIIESELEKKKNELELKIKQEDARNDWEKKINDTFQNLRDYLTPIESEHKRLNFLYYSYAILCVVTILLIIVCEITLLYKISTFEGLPLLQDYLIVLLPIPIAGALMWGFIFQMNRAQRQLIAVTNNIHSIKYIQGILLAINNLSVDINDGITRVNRALDKIIDNHLNRKFVLNEFDIKKEEDKDKVEIELDKLVKILSLAKK